MGVCFLEVILATEAALGGRIHLQPLARDLITALDAAPIGAGGDSLQRAIDRSYLGKVAAHGGMVGIDQRGRNRCVAGIGDLAEATGVIRTGGTFVNGAGRSVFDGVVCLP